MNTSAWVVAGLIAAFGIAYFVGTYRPAQRVQRAEGFARSVGLPLTDALRAVVTERVALRHRGGSAGLVIGILAGAFVLDQDPASSENYATPFLLIGGAFAGAAIGVAIAASRVAAPLDPDAVKFARPSAVALDDYVAPLERTGGRLVVGLAVVTLAAALVFDAPVSGALMALAVLAVAALLFFEIAGRRIVDRAQPAQSPADLTWDDAVRASVLRDMVTAPIILGADTVVVAGGALIDHVLAGSELARIALVVVCVAAAIALAIAAITSRPQRYFLRRLWPAVTA
jgi:hypothetical protein